MSEQPYSPFCIAVVYFEKDVDLACLLARSLDAFVPSEMVDEIIFLDNSSDPEAGYRAFETRIKSSFEQLSDRVRHISAQAFDVDSGQDSYSAQQALKLEVARDVRSPNYLVLDTKNHFTRPVSWVDFFVPDGRAKTHEAHHDGYFLTCLTHSMAYFGQEVGVEDPHHLPTITPYMLHRDTVRDMLDAIRSTDNLSVYEVIRANNKRTEFLLYYAYLKKTGQLEALYSFTPRPFVTLLDRSPIEDDAIDQHLATLDSPDTYAFAIHTKRFAQLSEKHIKAISAFWARRNIFPSEQAGRHFIKEQAEATPLPKPSPKLNPDGDGKVRVGRNGRLFIHKDSNGLLDQHLGRRLLSEADLKLWQDILDRRQVAAQAIGAQYHLLVAPDTAAIYPEDHPDLDGYDGLRPTLQLQQHLRPDTPWTYPIKDLREARLRREVCHPSDSHWTGFGAYIGYRALTRKLDMLRKLPPNRMKFINKESSGDLGNKFLPPIIAPYTECVFRDPPSKLVWKNGISNRGYIGYWRHRNPNLPRAILFTDSYGWKFARFLSASFSEMVMVHTPYFEQEAVDKYRPDVIVTLMAERFLLRVPDERTGIPAMQTAQEKDPSACYPDLEQLGE